MNLRVLVIAALLTVPVLAGDEPVRKPAPAFTLKNAEGKAVSLADYRGKVVLLNFWATWCTGCKQEIPWFLEFDRKYAGGGLAVLGVSLDDEGWKVLKPYLAEHPMSYPVLLGDDAVAGLYGGVDALPTTLLIDRAGNIAATHLGVVDRVLVEKEIRDLLAAH